MTNAKCKMQNDRAPPLLWREICNLESVIGHSAAGRGLLIDHRSLLIAVDQGVANLQCPRCGKDNPEGRTLCLSCWAPLTATPPAGQTQPVPTQQTGEHPRPGCTSMIPHIG